MKAENLAISLPYNGCNKNCPYYISKMTGYMCSDLKLGDKTDRMVRNAEKVAYVARTASVSSVLFTEKGEPLHKYGLSDMMKLAPFFKEFPMEVQTNGVALNHDTIINLHQIGINIVAISIDNWKQLPKLVEEIKLIQDLGMTVRLTINVTDKLGVTALEMLDYCKENNVKQITFREVVAPKEITDTEESRKTAEWIETHKEKNVEFNYGLKLLIQQGRLRRTTKDGVGLYIVDGVSIAHSLYCIQEEDNGEDIRSLVFQEDGHLYPGWDINVPPIF